MGNKKSAPSSGRFLTKCCEHPALDTHHETIQPQPNLAPLPSQSQSSRDGLQRLQEAEMEGARLINDAREFHKQKLEQARREAADEVAHFRAILEQHHARIDAEVQAECDVMELKVDAQMNREITEDANKAAAQKEECCQYIIGYTGGSFDNELTRTTVVSLQ